jgi:CheY-like chemotaxis protein/anti-sigma regulatory factor (Ser/Thr protein kinase)
MAGAFKLLVVDDDPSALDLVTAMLVGTEWEVDRANDGDEALEWLERGGCDLVLTDILMPRMDGLTLLAEIRNRYPELHVVIMTAWNTSQHVLDSLRHEAAAYISKPFSREMLRATLAEALSMPVEGDDIEILSDVPNWISLRVRSKLTTADRLTGFVRELPSDLKPEEREQVATAFRELLVNAIEHGAHLDASKTVDLNYIRTARTIVYYIRDPGEGFSRDTLEHAATANGPDDPIEHFERRQEMGLRPGGFGLLMAQNFADELIYSGKGNEVILIKYLT